MEQRISFEKWFLKNKVGVGQLECKRENCRALKDGGVIKIACV